MDGDPHMFDLRGRAALVTGGSKGLGRSMARALAAAGARVVISARDERALAVAADELSVGMEHPVRHVAVDLADRSALPAFCDAVERIVGPIDILVGNAAMEQGTLADAVDLAVVDRLIETNLIANIYLTSRFADGMKQRRWGRIVYVSSNAATVAGAWGHGGYSASKAALEAYGRCVAIELGPHGVTCNTIAPGTFLTEMSKSRLATMPPEQATAAHDGLAMMNAMGHWGDPADLEGAVLLLASNAGRFITGTVLPVDGGLTIKMAPS